MNDEWMMMMNKWMMNESMMMMRWDDDGCKWMMNDQ